LEKMPLTPNGKIDKKALPKPDGKVETEYVPPRSEAEEILAQVWSEVLGRERIGIYDNFFELGGHSLRAMRLLNRIESVTGVKIDLKEVFANPTIEGLAVIVTEAEDDSYLPIPKAEIKGYYEMSSAQKRIYIIQQMNPESIAYNMPQYLKLTGEIHLERVERTLQGLVNRHESLRTAFMLLEGELVQHVQKQATIDFEYVNDYRGNHENENEAEWWVSEFVKPFALGKASQVRVKVINMGSYHLLMFDMHHIISDGMSMSTFIHEFTTLYNGESLDVLTHQFKDYSEWMNRRDLSDQRDYWIGEFSDEIPVLDLPLDYARPKEQSFEGAVISLETGQTLGIKIKALALQTNTTEYMIFLASAMVLLSKYANQEDVIIGSPISGRTHQDTEQMLGMFVNTLAMRGYPEKEKSFARLLEEIKTCCLKAYENQEYPFEELVESIDIRRDLSRNPLFDVMLVLQNNEESKLKMDEVLLEEYVGETNWRIAKFDLTFGIWEIDDNYEIILEYCSTLFKKESMERMLEHYVELLRNLIKRPDLKLKEISMITQNEQRQILEDFNNTYADYPKDKTIVQLFEEQAEKTPDSISVVFENEELTYKELNEKANAIAYELRELGVNPDVIVGIIIENSIEMIAGVLGILKAGGAYLPIDPEFPIERVRTMLEDSKVKIVLSKKKITAHLNFIHYFNDIKVVNLAIDDIENRCSNFDLIAKSSNLAYIMYTSGSTGRPKGIMTEHSSVVNYIYAFTHAIGLTSESCQLQHGKFTFESLAHEVHPILSIGGKVVIITKDQLYNISILSSIVNKHRVTNLATTPQEVNKLNSYIQNLPIRTYTCGGEALRYANISNLTQNSLIYNSYGPTECTVYTSFYKCELKDEHTTIPIGKPIGNTKIYILDGADKLMPIGVPGELCIVGAGVTRGYLNRPNLTEELFVGDPYGNGRMYRTGDLARWLPDGNIMYLGRIDEQVKIRGFRVELGEIESVIRRMDDISSCAVVLREGKVRSDSDDNSQENSNEEKAICVYLVSDEEINLSEIRERLVKALPAYMIPTYMMQIERIPITNNGKLDKRALPEIEVRTETEYVPPRNIMEIKLSQIWSEVLGMKKVGVYDNFFDLGGNSLKSIELVSIARTHNIELSIQDVFNKPSIALLADATVKSDQNVIEYQLEDFTSLHKLLENNKINKEMTFTKQTLGDVFITGATGWLGAHILDKFISSEAGVAYCLVRGKNLADSQNRLDEVLADYFGEKYLNCSRIVVVCGDIVDKMMLDYPIDTVFHSAATVAHYGEYSYFYDMNVKGTENVILFAKEKSAQLIHISTMGVVGEGILKKGENSLTTVYDETKLFVGQTLNNVYLQSKFEAEIAVLQAKLSGLPAMIIRVGNLMNRFSDLKFQKNYQENAFLTRLKAIVDLGVYPSDIKNSEWEISPVDSAAAAIIKLAQHFNHQYSLFHVYNPKTAQFIDFITALEMIERKIEAVSHEKFLNEMKNAVHILGKERIYELLPNEQDEVVPLSMCNDFTCLYLQEIGFEWYEIKGTYLEAYLQYFEQLGYWDS